MDDVLLELLQRLEVVGDGHAELFDSDVREAMSNAVFDGFIRPRADYILPEKFAMFTAEGERKVRAVLTWFLATAPAAAEAGRLSTFHKRLRAFQKEDIRTSRTNGYDDFFGWSNPDFFNEDGVVIRT